MSSSFEKSVKGGTKIKLAAPKSKYVEHILVATHAGEAGVAEVFRTLTNRLRDSTWTIVFKGLIIVHLMVREGEPNVTLKYLAESQSKLAISNFSDVQVQGANIRHYHNYILTRAKSYRDTKLDWVREGQGRLKRQTIDKGLLRETESVQKQIAALLKCNLLSNEPENEITLTAFRLLTMDLLILFHVMNEGTINVLEHYFEMSKYDAERALAIYKTFSKQTTEVVEFLSVARQYENATRLEIPKLKHAPTSLTASLEEYIHDPDFEINRRQYLAQQEVKKTGKPMSNGVKESAKDFKKINQASPSQQFPDPKPFEASAARQEPKGPAPDLIDFFESIEQNQQPMEAQPQQQISNFQPIPQYQYQQQVFNSQPNYLGQNQPQLPVNGAFAENSSYGQEHPQQQAQNDFTGAGFGGYRQQSQQPQQPFSPPISGISQNPNSSFPSQEQQFTSGPQQPSTNPFRQSTFTPSTIMNTPPPFISPPFTPSSFTSSSFTGSSAIPSPESRQPTNPFARRDQQQSVQTTQISSLQNSPFAFAPPQSATSTTSPSSFFSSLPMQSPQNTMQSIPQQQQPLQPLQLTQTGTNPFARSAPQSGSQTPLTSPLQVQPTGSTNPFRKSQFINQQTGQGWQTLQGTMGGLEQLPTIPVFPRPGEQQQQPGGFTQGGFGQQPHQQQQQTGWP